MDNQRFINAYRESRNGANHMIRHPLARNVIYSDGVQECAEAGCYWLLDVLATELPAAFRKHPGATLCIVTVKVKNEEASIVGSFGDGDKKPYRRRVGYTDMPTGEWVFYAADDGAALITLILPSEY